VLPFADMSPGGDQEYFSDGLADTLMHVLAQVKGLKVAARTSSFAFKGQNMDVGQIAEQLGVATILEGSVQKAGDKIRVIAQLIDAGDGSHLWSQNFDRDLADIFAVQDEIAQEVVAALKVTLLDSEQGALTQRYQPTLEAYEQFILGRREMATRRIENMRVAANHFEKAIELDPDYALAYVNLADAYSLLQFYSGLSTERALELMPPLLDKALELAPQSGEVFASLGQLADLQGDSERAMELQRKAIELSPNYATAYHWHAVNLRQAGRYEEALIMIRKAADLDPMAPIIRANITETLMGLGRLEEAEVLARRNVESDPEFPLFLADMAGISAMKGEPATSMRWRQALTRVDPDNAFALNRVCRGYLELADPQSAQSCLEVAQTRFPDTDATRLLEVNLAWHNGDYRRAADILLNLLEKHERRSGIYDLASSFLAWTRAMLGDLEGARDALAVNQPELFDGDLPDVAIGNLYDSGLAAWLMTQLDQSERGLELVGRIEAWIALNHRTRGPGYDLEDAAAFMVRGDPQQALARIRTAIDENWTDDWWIHFRHDPRFRPLHEDPEFQALAAEMENAMLAQRALFEQAKGQPLL
jgi:TolB-like protein/Tfp pilus assembly protein PilF